MASREKTAQPIILYKISLSLLLGLLSFLGTFKTTSLPWGEVNLLFSWSLGILLLVAMAWGVPYVLFAYFGGLAFLFPFYVGAYNGWGSVLTSLVFLLYLIMHAWAAAQRRLQRHPLWLLNPWLIHLFYVLLRLLLYFTLYPLLIRWNPPFWTADALTSISSQILLLYSIRGILMETLFLGLVRTLLMLPWIRRIFLLKVSTTASKSSRIVYAMAGLGLFFSLLIQILHHRLLGNAPDFTFLLSPSSERIVLIVFTVGIMAIAGGYAASYVDRILRTQQKLSESEDYLRKVYVRLRCLNAELEDRVEERSEELASLGEELESYAHTISHDLKTPLRAISGYCTMIQEYMQQDLDDASRHDLADMERLSQNTMKLIDALLDYSLLAHQPLKKSWMDMEGLIREAWSHARPDSAPIPDNSIAHTALPPVYGDPPLLGKALLELFRSEELFPSTPGLPSLGVTAQELTEGALYLFHLNNLTFGDGALQNPFRLFREKNASPHPDSRLGLATAKKIIELHGGRVFLRRFSEETTLLCLALPHEDRFLTGDDSDTERLIRLALEEGGAASCP